MRFARKFRLLLFALMLLAAPAVARADGVHTDPNSPTSKEYAIPLDSARHAAASGGGGSVASQGGGSTSSATTAPAPLFGVGVKPSGGSRPSTHRAHRVHRKSTKRHGAGAAASSTPPPTRPSHLADATNTPGGGITTPVLIGGLAAVALLLGGLGGFAVRRRLA